MIDKIVRARAAGGLALAIGAATASHACQTTPGTQGGAPMCTYLEQIKCGPENRCTSTCLLDLSAYGPCICGDAGTDGGDGGKKDAR
jgi:hypothetical protein